MSPRLASVSTHTHSGTFTTQHTPGQTEADGLHSATLLFYFGLHRQKGVPVPKHGFGAVERSGSAANQLWARRRRSSVWRTHGIPLTQDPRERTC